MRTWLSSLAASAGMVLSLLAPACAWAGAQSLLTDLWSNPNEQGWGMNVIQQEDVLFVTLFVYGSDGRPAWYVGPGVIDNGSGVYSGALYSTNGPYFGGPFNPSAVTSRQVGTIKFDGSCTAADCPRVTYNVDSATVVKTVQRQTWRLAVLPPSGHGVLIRRPSSTCTGYPTGPTLVSFTTSPTQIRLTDSSGTIYSLAYTSAATRQDGRVMSITPATFTVSGAPAFGNGGGASIEMVYGTNGQGTINAALVGIGTNNCVLVYSFAGIAL